MSYNYYIFAIGMKIGWVQFYCWTALLFSLSNDSSRDDTGAVIKGGTAVEVG